MALDRTQTLGPRDSSGDAGATPRPAAEGDLPASPVTDEVAAGHLVALPLADADLVKEIKLIAPAPLPATSAAARFAAHALGHP